ncbi:MAG: hypothetical protein AAGI71_16800 [Bacteroidota bacterium]
MPVVSASSASPSASAATSPRHRVPSGVAAVEAAWHGLERGGAYLCHGDDAAGTQLLGLASVQAGVTAHERCLYLSPTPLAGLCEHAEAMGFDLRHAHAQGQVRLLKHPSPPPGGPPDDFLDRTLAVLSQHVRTHPVDRLVIDHAGALLAFDTASAYFEAVPRFLARVRATQTTVLLVVRPAPQGLRRAWRAFLLDHLTGQIRVDLVPLPPAERPRQVTLAGPPEAPVHATRYRRLRGLVASTHPLRAGLERPDTRNGRRLPSARPVVTRSYLLARLRPFFEARGPEASPFMVVALRLPPPHAGARSTRHRLYFEIAVRFVQGHPLPDAVLYADRDDGTLVLLLPSSQDEAAEAFFRAFYAWLDLHFPQHRAPLAELLHAVALREGQPFQSATDCLAYVLDAPLP